MSNTTSNTYYCDVCHVVTESFSEYDTHVRGFKHAKMIQNENFGDKVNDSKNSEENKDLSSFSGYTKRQISSSEETVNITIPLPSKGMEIPEFGETLNPEPRDTVNTVCSVSLDKPDNNSPENLKSVHQTAEAVNKSNNQAERMIEEFIKDCLGMHNSNQISSEVKDSNENDKKRPRLGRCRSRKESSKSLYPKKRKISNEKRENISSDESVIDLISSDNESIIISESDTCSKTSLDGKLKKTPCAVYATDVNKEKLLNNAKEVSETGLGSSVQHNSNIKYPQPPTGVNRIKVEIASVIQTSLKNLKHPCIGLDRIIEIRGLDGIHYYCEMCEFSCSFHNILLAHLDNFQHRLESLKPFVPLIYENYSKQKPYEIENKVNETIKTLVEMFGCGNIRVEKEYQCESDPHSSTSKENHGETKSQHFSNRIHYSFSSTSTTVKITANSGSEPCRSKNNSSVKSRISSQQNSFHTNCNAMETVTSTSVADSSHSSHNLQVDQQNVSYQEVSHDSVRKFCSPKYYCELCNIFTDTIEQWELHIRGGRHAISCKNVYESTNSANIDSRIFSQDSFYTNYNCMETVTNQSELDFSYSIYNWQEDQYNMSRQEKSYYDPVRKPCSSKYYCNVCNTFTDTIEQWELHIRGGRHIINCKKARGELPIRRNPEIIPYARAVLMSVVDRIEEPLVGLDMINEIHDSDAPGPLYRCLLCNNSKTSMDIIDHILSVRHRIKFLEKIQYPSLKDFIRRCKDEYCLDNVIRNVCADLEAEQGRGYLNVFVR